MGKKKRLKELQRSSKHWLVWLIYGCAVLAVITPLFTPTSTMANYSMIKTLPYQALVEIMLAAWIVLAVADRKYRPHWNVLNVSLLIFAAAIGLSLFFSLDPWMSFWSTTNRLLGVVTTWHHIIWLFVLSCVLRDRADWQALIKWSVKICAAVVVITIVRWTGNISDLSIVKSVFGNTSYLASYLLPHVFLALYLWSQEASYKKYFWLLLSVAIGFTIVLTGSRAAILSLLAASALAAIGLALVSGISRGKKVAMVLLSLFIFGSLVGGFFVLRTETARSWMAGAGRMPAFMTRLATRDFGGDRLVLWGMALKGIAERPIFGWGNEQFIQVSSIYLDPINTRATEVFSESWFDRSHNQYLDYLISYGFVGFIAYLAVWLALAYLLIHLYRRSEELADRRGVALLAVMFVSYLGYSIFFFDTPQLLMVLFMVMALVIFLTYSNAEVEKEPLAAVNPSIPLFVVLLIPIAVFGWFANGEHFIATNHFVQGAAWMKVDWHKAKEEMELSFSKYNPYRYEIQTFIMEPVRQSIDVSYDGYRNKDGLPEFLAMVADTTAEAVKNHPNNIRGLYLATEAQRYNYLYDKSALERASEYHARFMELAPERFDAHLQMAELEVLRGNLEESLKWFDSAYERHFKLNNQYGGYILYRKACVLAQLRDFDDLAETIRLAAQKFPATRDARLILALGKVVQLGDDLSGFETLLDPTLTNFHDHWEILAAGAKIYHVMGHEDMVQQVLAAPAMQELLETEEGRAEYGKLLEEIGL